MASQLGATDFSSGPVSVSTVPTAPNHVARRAELDVVNAPPIFLSGVTKFVGTGSGANSDAAALAFASSASRPLGSRYQFTEAATGARRTVRLVLSTAANALPSITRGLDFDAATNPRVYVLESPLTSDDVPEGQSNRYFTPERAGTAPGSIGDMRYIGPHARMVSVVGGFKFQVSSDGVQWQDALGPAVAN